MIISNQMHSVIDDNMNN